MIEKQKYRNVKYTTMIVLCTHKTILARITTSSTSTISSTTYSSTILAGKTHFCIANKHLNDLVIF